MDFTLPIAEPSFCPNPTCTFHQPRTDWRFIRRGSFARKHPPCLVQRFQCLECGRCFSSQTFSVGYCCRRQDLFAPVFLALMSCAGIRQVARQLSLTRGVVTCRLERLARHCLLLNEMLRPKDPTFERLVLDGFETFEYSQYAPMHLNFLVGESLLIHGFTESELRRKGRMTPWQRRRRAELEARHGRPDPRAVQAGVETLLHHVVPQGASVVLHSDEHPAYARAVRALEGHATIHHHVTHSTERRTPANPLFPVNLTDLLLRHGSANHKRETIAFSKRRQSVVDRASMFVTWRNLLKSRSEKAQDAPPAVALRLVPRRVTAGELFTRRLFPSHVELPPHLKAYYERRIKTRYLASQRVHQLAYAY